MGRSSLPWEAFLGAAYPDLSSTAAVLSAKVYTKILMCAEQGLERAVPRPGCSGLSLRAWGPQRLLQRLAVSSSGVMFRDQSFRERGDSGCSVCLHNWMGKGH